MSEEGLNSGVLLYSKMRINRLLSMMYSSRPGGIIVVRCPESAMVVRPQPKDTLMVVKPAFSQIIRVKAEPSLVPVRDAVRYDMPNPDALALAVLAEYDNPK